MRQLIPTSWKHAVETLRSEMHHLLDRLLPRHTRAIDTVEPYQLPTRMSMGWPYVDVEENDETVMVTAELPGLAPEDFTVSLVGDRLTIRGEKKTSTEETGRHYYAVERRYGAFMRALTLPCEVDADQAAAQYKHGVLRLTLPKTAAARARRVQVPITT